MKHSAARVKISVGATAAALFLAWSCIVGYAAEAPSHEYRVTKPGFSASGMTQGEFNDAVSTFSGGLTAAYTDLRLPGKGGLDVVVSRVYNSKYKPATDSQVQSGLAVGGVDSPLGLGWTIMVAPELIDVSSEGSGNPGPQLVLPDGSSFYFYPPPNFNPKSDTPSVFNSKGFWRLQYWPSWKAPQVLTVFSPTGIRYTYNWYIQPYNNVSGGCCPARADACGNPCLYMTAAQGTFRWERWCYGSNCSVATVYAVMVPKTITDANGNTITIFYQDAGGQPTEQVGTCIDGTGYRARIDYITDTLGRTIDFVYAEDAQRRPQRLSQITAAGHTIAYNVTRPSGFNQLNSVTHGELTTSYGYYGDGSLKSITAPSGARVEYGWANHDFDARIARSTSQGTETLQRKITTPVVTTRTVWVNGTPRVTSYTYPTYPQGSSSSDDYKRTRVTDPEGHYTDFYHIGYEAMASAAFREADIGRVEMIKRYDKSGQLLQTEKFNYTAFAITTVETDELFTQSVFVRGAQKQELYRGSPIPASLIASSSVTSFDGYGNPLTVLTSGVDAPTKTTTYTYDSCNPFDGGTMTCDPGVYIVQGLVKSKTISGTPEYHEEFIHNGRGQVTTHTMTDSPANHVTTFLYYAGGDYNGQPQTITRQGSPNNRTTTFNAYQWGVASDVSDDVGTIIKQTVRPDGLIQDQTDRNNQKTSYGYTTAGLLQTVDLPTGFDDQTIAYDWTVPKVTVTQGVTKTIYTYDQAMELTGTEVATGNGSVFTRTDYDRRGQPIKQYVPKLAAIMSDDPRTETDVDGLGRPVEVRDIAEDVRTTKYAYLTPNSTRITDAKNRATTLAYDGFNRLHSVTDANQHATTYTYNHLDALMSVNQEGDSGNASLNRSFTYTPAGQLLSETHPESGTTTYGYTDFGEVKTRTQNGRTIAFGYDDRGRQTSIDYPDRTDTVLYYDNAPPSACTSNCLDRLTAVTDETGKTLYTKFDALGHLQSKAVELTIGGTTYNYTVGYNYDTLGRLKDLTYPSGRKLTYDYDAANRLTKLQHTLGGSPIELIRSVTYTAASSPDTIIYGDGLNGPNGVVADWSADKRFRPTRLDLLKSGAQGLPWTLTYDVYDAVDNVREMHVNSQKESYGYDALDRLTSASLELTEGNQTVTRSLTYQYDPFGNRLSRTSNVPGIANQNFTYTNNQMNGFIYDANGNLTNDGQHTYTFTVDNKLRSVDGGAETFYYNTAGERVIAVHNDGRTVFYAYEGGQPVTKWELR